MTTTIVRGLTLLSGLAFLAGAATTVEARERTRDRPLTITKRATPGSGVQVLDGGNRIIAWGGFSANGYGWGPPNSPAARRAARNASVRYRTAGVYGYGFDGLGGSFDGDDLRSGGYNNPNYGNAYNAYIGTPTALEFGPGFASRHITDSDDADNENDTGPTPAQIGYSLTPGGIDLDD